MPTHKIVHKTLIARDTCQLPNNFTLKVLRTKNFIEQASQLMIFVKITV